MADPFHDMEGRTARATAIGRHLAVTTRSPVLWLTLCGALLVTAILAGTIMMVGEFRERALSNSVRELENTVLLLTRHFDQQFEDSEYDRRRRDLPTCDFEHRFIGGIQGTDVEPEGTRDLELQSRRAVLSWRYFHLRFERRHDHLVETLPAPAVNISARAYFETFKSDPRSPSVLSEAVRSLITGNLNTVIAHRLTGADGVFLGVMTRRITPSNYEKFFASIALGTGRDDLDVPCRRDTDSALSARRCDDRTEIHVRSPAAAGPEPGRPADDARRAESDRPNGPARLRRAAVPFPRRRRRDRHDIRRAGGLARANPVPGHRRTIGRQRWSR